jgi:hypothetical protein
LERESGKTLADWVQLVRAEMPPSLTRPRECLNWLKERHGILQNRGILILSEAFPEMYGSVAESPEEHLAAHFKSFTHLRPLFDAVVEAARQLGPDVQVTPQKSFVSLVRTNKFGQLKPTKKGLLLGLALDKALPLPEGFAAPKVPDRICVECYLQPDSAQQQWLPYLQQAYARS